LVEHQIRSSFLKFTIVIAIQVCVFDDIHFTFKLTANSVL
jgi:hypothetical protein